MGNQCLHVPKVASFRCPPSKHIMTTPQWDILDNQKPFMFLWPLIKDVQSYTCNCAICAHIKTHNCKLWGCIHVKQGRRRLGILSQGSFGISGPAAFALVSLVRACIKGRVWKPRGGEQDSNYWAVSNSPTRTKRHNERINVLLEPVVKLKRITPA